MEHLYNRNGLKTDNITPMDISKVVPLNEGRSMIPSYHDTMYVTSPLRKDFLKDHTFADAHLFIGVTFHDDDVMTNIILVVVFIILEKLAFPSGRKIMIPCA